MLNILFRIVPVCLMLFSFVTTGFSQSESLNPEGVNPHASTPRKKISHEQKLAAAEAMKKRKAEIAARNAAKEAKKNSINLSVTDPASGENVPAHGSK